MHQCRSFANKPQTTTIACVLHQNTTCITSATPSSRQNRQSNRIAWPTTTTTTYILWSECGRHTPESAHTQNSFGLKASASRGLFAHQPGRLAGWICILFNQNKKRWVRTQMSRSAQPQHYPLSPRCPYTCFLKHSHSNWQSHQRLTHFVWHQTKCSFSNLIILLIILIIWWWDHSIDNKTTIKTNDLYRYARHSA